MYGLQSRYSNFEHVYFDRLMFGGRLSASYALPGKMASIQIFESTLSASDILTQYQQGVAQRDRVAPVQFNSIQIYDVSNNRFDPSLNT